MLAGVIWALENPRQGIVEPEEMDFVRVLEICQPYLGRYGRVWSDWSPLKERNAPFPEISISPIPGSSKISACSKRRRAHNAAMIRRALICCLLLCLIVVPVRAAETKEQLRD